MRALTEMAYRVVAQALAHLFAILCKDEAVADQALEGRLLKQRCGEHHQGVEPASGLVNACMPAQFSQQNVWATSTCCLTNACIHTAVQGIATAGGVSTTLEGTSPADECLHD